MQQGLNMKFLWLISAILLLIGVFINPLGIMFLLAVALMLAREPMAMIEDDSD